MFSKDPPPLFLQMTDRAGAEAGRAFRYNVAGQPLLSDAPLALLSHQRESFSPSRESPRGATESMPVTHSHAACGWVAGREREVRCRYSDQEIGVEVEGVGAFRVARGSGAIACRGVSPGIGRDELEETLLGPPLGFALIVRGIWCLHASACVSDRGAVLILGQSGDGKSTLAEAVDHHGAGNIVRAADDIVPCSFVGGAAQAHFHFPQLKLPTERQYPLSAPKTVPIRALVMLDKSPPEAAVAKQELAPAAAAKRVAEQTIAVKLFDRALHRAHLQWLAELIGAIPTWRLRYPHDRNKVAEAARRVIDLMEAGKE